MYFTSVEKAISSPDHLFPSRGLILIIPIAFLFARLWEMTGVWMSFPATEFVTAVIGAGLYVKYKNRKWDIKQNPPRVASIWGVLIYILDF